MRNEKLIEALSRFAKITVAVRAPKPGSNLLNLLGMQSKCGRFAIYGEEMEALYRAGLLSADPAPTDLTVPRTEEYGGIAVDYAWRITPAGHAALAGRTTRQTNCVDSGFAAPCGHPPTRGRLT